MEEEERKNKILIDTTFLFDQYSTRGHGRYGKEILRRLIKDILDDGWELHLMGFWDLPKNLMQIKFSQLAIEELLPKINFISMGPPSFSGVKNYFRWNNSYKFIINEVEPDIFFATHFERGLPTVPAFKNKIVKTPKVAVTLHDVIPLVTNKFSSKGKLQNFLKAKFYKTMFEGVVNSDLVLTCSEFSKKDIIKFGKVEESKVEVIYLGIDDMFYRENYEEEVSIEESILSKFELKKENYFFYDSGIEENKGIKELLGVFSQIVSLKKSPFKELVVTSGRDLTAAKGRKIKAKTALGKKFLKAARELNVIDNITTLGRVSDQELLILLHNAGAYIYLSKYEGFGFGPLQAMASEIPTFAANLSCLPEITNGGAVLLNIDHFKESAKTINKYLSDEKLKKELIKKGKKVVKVYNWEITASKSWEKIKNLI